MAIWYVSSPLLLVLRWLGALGALVVLQPSSLGLWRAQMRALHPTHCARRCWTASARFEGSDLNYSQGTPGNQGPMGGDTRELRWPRSPCLVFLQLMPVVVVCKCLFLDSISLFHVMGRRRRVTSQLSTGVVIEGEVGGRHEGRVVFPEARYVHSSLFHQCPLFVHPLALSSFRHPRFCHPSFC